MKKGDNNSHFFRWVANSHRTTNHIRGIEVDGVLYEDEGEVWSKVVHFSQDLYTIKILASFYGQSLLVLRSMNGLLLRGIFLKRSGTGPSRDGR